MGRSRSSHPSALRIAAVSPALHPPFHLPLPEGAALRVVSGGPLYSGCCGVRVGEPDSIAGRGTFAVLYDSATAEPLRVTAYAFAFGRLRTAAAIALATDMQARPAARSVGLIGTEPTR